jgi:glycosyltransferase involved in cell wall biosynthesis
MTAAKLTAALRSIVRRLRHGDVPRLGPVGLVSLYYLNHLRERIRQLEHETAVLRAGGATTPTRSVPTEAKPRSVVFLHQDNYHFFYLAQALRRRGWDALSVSLEGPDSPNARYYHGEDLNLYDPDPAVFARKTAEFAADVRRRFRMVHFYGKGQMSFFPATYDHDETYSDLPTDFVELRRCGIKIGYTVCGCLDGIAQSSFHRWSGGACDKCVWQNEPQMCSDRRNLAWGHKVAMFCDLVATEGDPALDYQSGPACYREPLTTALDPEFWRPDLAIPEHRRLAREPNELIVFHAVGNFATRTRAGRNIKGTPAVIAAVERLRGEGVPVRLEFVSDMANREVRFVQAQADVIVDQLNFGRYGATAREGLMLGKPTVCRIDVREPTNEHELASLRECPLVTADEATIYTVLRDLLLDADKRRRIGAQSRAYALKWHAADACAERFERVYDRLMTGQPIAAG